MEMTDRELLETVATQVGKLTQDVQGLKGDVQGLKGDVQGLKDDAQGLKGDVQGLKDDAQGLKGDVQEIKKTVIHIENDHGSKLKALFDGYVQNSEKLNRIDKEVSRQQEVIIRKIK